VLQAQLLDQVGGEEFVGGRERYWRSATHMLVVLQRAGKLAVVGLVGLLGRCGGPLGAADGADVLAEGVLAQADHAGPFVAGGAGAGEGGGGGGREWLWVGCGWPVVSAVWGRDERVVEGGADRAGCGEGALATSAVGWWWRG